MADELKSLLQQFDKKIYRIPDYQRGYAWGLDQLKDFWDDLINLPDANSHYIGMLSLKQVDANVYEKWSNDKWLINGRGFKAYYVIDGQQRLTTSIILINEIINLAKKENIKTIKGIKISEIEKMFVWVTNSNGIDRTFIFGYEVDNPSFKFWKSKILGKENTLQVDTFYTKNLLRAKNFFIEQLKDKFTRSKEGFKTIEDIYWKLVNKFKFNIHELEDDLDTFVAFETMNNRGKKLSTLELLKNRLIYLTTLFPITSDYTNDTQNTLRESITNAWKEVYKQLGKNPDNVLDDDAFLEAHWKVYFGYNRSKKHPYVDFLLKDKFSPKNIYKSHTTKLIVDAKVLGIDEDNESDIEARNNEQNSDNVKPNEILSYVRSLEEMSQYWYYTFFPEQNHTFSHKTISFIQKLNRLGISYFRPLVMVILSIACTSQNEIEQRELLLELIEKFIFIYFRMGMKQSNTKDSYYFKFTKELFSAKQNNDYDKINTTITSIIDSLKKSLADSNEINNLKHSFAVYIHNNFDDQDGFYSWKSIRYFLYEYELYMIQIHGSGIEKITPKLYFGKSKKDKYSIEHIYPQTATNDYWLTKFNGYSEKEKEYLTGSLGNLLPLSQSINSTIQNYEFSEKKKRFINDSHCAIEVAKQNDWCPKDIYNRSIKMFEFLNKRWGVQFTTDQIKEIINLDFVNDGRVIPSEIDPDDKIIAGSINDASTRNKKIWLLVLNNKINVSDTRFNYDIEPIQMRWNYHDFARVGTPKTTFYIHIAKHLKTDVYKQFNSTYTNNICVGLFIRSNKVYSKLCNLKIEILDKLGFKTKWFEDGLNFRIEHFIPNFDKNNPSSWPKIVKEAVQKLVRIYNVFSIIIDEILQTTSSSMVNKWDFRLMNAKNLEQCNKCSLWNQRKNVVSSKDGRKYVIGMFKLNESSISYYVFDENGNKLPTNTTPISSRKWFARELNKEITDSDSTRTLGKYWWDHH